MATLKEQDYPAYYAQYLAKINAANILDLMSKYAGLIEQFIHEIPDDKANFAYAKNKWTIKEVLQHLIDSERVFVYRAMRFARKDFIELEGYDENEYTKNAHANCRDFSILKQEFLLLRKTTDLFLLSLTEEDLQQKGIANNEPITVHAIVFIIYAHILHHIDVLKERYL